MFYYFCGYYLPLGVVLCYLLQRRYSYTKSYSVIFEELLGEIISKTEEINKDKEKEKAGDDLSLEFK